MADLDLDLDLGLDDEVKTSPQQPIKSNPQVQQKPATPVTPVVKTYKKAEDIKIAQQPSNQHKGPEIVTKEQIKAKLKKQEEESKIVKQRFTPSKVAIFLSLGGILLSVLAIALGVFFLMR